LPAFERVDQRILQSVLRQLEIAELTDERRQDTTVFLSKRLFDQPRKSYHS
jgi:hypothetical protein